MKRLLSILLVLALSVQVALADRASDLRALFLGKDRNYVFVAAHRGDWRNAPENSLQAIDFAIKKGADIIEIDAKMTADGHLVVMHDKTVDRTTNGKGKVEELTLEQIKKLRLRSGSATVTIHEVPTLEEAMLMAKGRALVNIDQGEKYLNEIYPILVKTGTVDQVVLKGGSSYEKLTEKFGDLINKFIYMPIVTLDKPDAQEKIEVFIRELKPSAIEYCFKRDDYPLIDELAKYDQKYGVRVWVNSLWPSLCGPHDDEAALADPNAAYGWMLSKGTTLIQTDRIEYLIDYLTKAGRRSPGTAATASPKKKK